MTRELGCAEPSFAGARAPILNYRKHCPVVGESLSAHNEKPSVAAYLDAAEGRANYQTQTDMSAGG